MKVNVLTLVGYLFTVLCYAGPIILLLILRLRKVRQIANALIGICVYINFFVLVYLVLFCNVIGGRIGFLKDLLDQPVSYALLLVLVGGTLCEFGRYLGLRFGLGESHKWRDAMGLGLGYGLAATFGLATDSMSTVMMVNYVMVSSEGGVEEYYRILEEAGVEHEAAQSLLEQVMAMKFIDGFVFMFQLLMIITVSVAVSVLVLGAVRKDTYFKSMPILCVWVAAASHIFTDGLPILLTRILKVPMILVILYMILVTAGAGYFLYVSWKQHPGEGIKAGIKEAAREAKEAKNGVVHASISEMAAKKTADIDTKDND
ncbi:MAG: YhfC family intramembrane metalloprotease [Lachnospiraceae bacterium]|nr:YhfC family intramembrane metalloprotease [Lachnospiraceae bacterium]